MKPKIFTTLDLEMNQPSGKIISIGAVVGDISDGRILDRLHVFVNPEEKITEYITNLTGITQEDVDNKGVSVNSAYAQLEKLHLNYLAFRNCLTWGGGDIKELLSQSGRGTEGNGAFGRRWIDVKTVFISYCLANDLSVQSGLSKSLTKIGLQFSGKKHNALSDAENTFRMYCELIKRMKQK